MQIEKSVSFAQINPLTKRIGWFFLHTYVCCPISESIESILQACELLESIRRRYENFPLVRIALKFDFRHILSPMLCVIVTLVFLLLLLLLLATQFHAYLLKQQRKSLCAWFDFHLWHLIQQTRAQNCRKQNKKEEEEEVYLILCFG